MTHLLEKETPFVFSKDCIDAFETLKNKLTEAPILVVSDWNLSFELMCDANDFAIGAILGQHKKEHFQPIHYANKTMTEAQKYYTTMEKEMLVVVVKAEYRANAVDETCWLRNLLRELHTPLSSATLVYCDNVSVVYVSSNPVQHQRTKHIEIDIHFVLDLVATGQVRVLHVPSRYQFADIFTKGLPTFLFEEFRSSLSVRCPPAQTAAEC
nr:NBS-containing resistance-like protein [Tanacetum cinerariifolium]